MYVDDFDSDFIDFYNTDRAFIFCIGFKILISS